jgi:hypothetical protein
MATIDTFEWLVRQFWPNPDGEAKRFIADERDYLLKIRSEDERGRYLEDLVNHMREIKKKKSAS